MKGTIDLYVHLKRKSCSVQIFSEFSGFENGNRYLISFSGQQKKTHGFLAFLIKYKNILLLGPSGSNLCFSFAPELVGYSA